MKKSSSNIALCKEPLCAGSKIIASSKVGFHKILEINWNHVLYEEIELVYKSRKKRGAGIHIDSERRVSELPDSAEVCENPILPMAAAVAQSIQNVSPRHVQETQENKKQVLPKKKKILGKKGNVPSKFNSFTSKAFFMSEIYK